MNLFRKLEHCGWDAKSIPFNKRNSSAKGQNPTK